MTYPQNLSREINVFQEWIKDMQAKPEIDTPEESYAVLRAVLQTIRDRLNVNEVAHLSAQLPTIARGVFFEGWRPSVIPESYSLQEFYDRIRHRLSGACSGADPGLLARHVFEVMGEHMDEGQMRHLSDNLPKEFKRLMPEPMAA